MPSFLGLVTHQQGAREQDELLQSVPGVAEVTWITWFGAYYQESKNFVFALPIDTDSYFNVHKNEFIVSAERS